MCKSSYRDSLKKGKTGDRKQMSSGQGLRAGERVRPQRDSTRERRRLWRQFCTPIVVVAARVCRLKFIKLYRKIDFTVNFKNKF